jgi:hypothetical protein
MLRYLLVSLGSGLLFGILDGLLNANPLAVRLLEVYKPIARPSVNVAAGVIIDLAYGFILAAVFLLLYPSLPGESGIVKGLSFAVLVWFLRVVMQAASTWVTWQVPPAALGYQLIAGLVEMLVLGSLYGLALKPLSG